MKEKPLVTYQEAADILGRQAQGDLGVLLGGRSEILIASQAIMDSPLIGHGSWAKDPHYSYLYAELKFGPNGGDIPFLRNELIPSHSVIFGAWVESGIVGALFWAGVLILVAKVLLRLFSSDDPLVPVIAFIGFLMLWDIFFSPFGADRRFTLAFFVVLMTLVYPALYGAKYSRQDDNNEEEWDDYDDQDDDIYDPIWEEREKYRTLDVSRSRRRR
jgi:O-antigen ligase